MRTHHRAHFINNF